MTTKDITAACNYWLDSPVFQRPRPSKDNYDFGDQATVGKHLKRSSKSFHQLEVEKDFGLYLGKHPDGYVVGIKGTDLKLSSAEVYENLSDLKQCWELD